jgi:hypothetical protein
MRSLKVSLAAVAFAMVAPAFATNFDLGNLTVASPVSQTQSFGALYFGGFTDYYTFTIDNPSTVSGTVAETDGYAQVLFWNLKLKDLDVTSLTLSKLGDSGFTKIVDGTPDTFSFATLTGGTYKLQVDGNVQLALASGGSNPPNGAVSSYTITASAASVASAAPEAADLVLTALGLAGVGFWARRRSA